ncbi:MAG: hypothetical protein L6Q37_05020 [Bdellovibrionaceae bacterium]|nr:hypothetical protein [Pseudobdellovibrionaceae bacterium]NUM58020.1 hypothetical protein [Pseudobdellovibrionaceae bacterium]
MKKIIVFSFIFLISFTIKADIISCSFTEPFVSTEYSMTQSTLTISAAGHDSNEEKTIIKNVSFQIKSEGSFELISKEGKVLQNLLLNYKGSDGMSDTVYPYDVKDFTYNKDSFPIFGGCSSNHLKAKTIE